MEDKGQRLDRKTEGTMGSDEMETWNRGSQDGTEMKLRCKDKD